MQREVRREQDGDAPQQPARPYRATSGTPAGDAMNAVLDTTDAAPPATAAAPSMNSPRRRLGTRPGESSRPASLEMATLVPIASKKSLRLNVKTNTTAVM